MTAGRIKVSLARWLLGGILLGGASALLLVKIVEYPLLSALPGGLRLYATASCPGTSRVLRQIESSSGLRGSVLVVPADAADDAFNGRICELLNRQLWDRRSWLSILPDSALCAVLAREAAIYYDLNFIGSPAWAIDMERGTSEDALRLVQQLELANQDK